MKISSVFAHKNLFKKKKQTGLSLIELLIAMLIGLFLLIGITTSYLSSKKSSVTRDQVSILQDNGRAALEILTETLQHAGYRSTSLGLLEDAFMINDQPTSTSCGGTINSVVNPNIFPATNIVNDNATGDSIGITYLGDNELNTDCAGGLVEALPAECRVGSGAAAEASEIYNAFFIDNNTATLQCAGSRSTAPVDIAEGVENIQILYGINADDDDSKSVERYVRASDVGNDWGLVVSIQIAILVRTPLEIKTQAESKTFSLLDEEVTTNNDRFQRAVFTTSINLRNI